jgi:excisionase family DNA binding protein
MNEKLLYRVGDVAACLSLSRTKVYELVRSGTLPSVRIGGARRVRGADLAAYVDSLERVATVEELAETVGAR